ncbi:halocyanin [Halobacteriales archaeon SW_7_68_16]|nr:MAG: halocyanin [Halobacteriales archaeon SW_7_68_16]
MNRREFITVAGAGTTAVGATVAGAGAAQEGTAPNGTENGTTTPNGTATPMPDDGDETVTVDVGPGGNFVYAPGTDEPLYITPGTTIEFVWQSDNHNVVVDSQPDDADWAGYEPTENAGFTYFHTFETMGTYEYFCQPHQNLGMAGTIVVNEDGRAPGGGSGGGEVDPEELGVAFQAHFVGIATILAIIVSLIFAFYVLKYGESPNSSSPNRE